MNQIIAYASRDFARFYALQGAVAFQVAWKMRSLLRRGAKLLLFSLITLICLAVFSFGLPSE